MCGVKRLVVGLGVTAALGWFAVPAQAQPAPAPSPPLVRAGGTAPLLLIFDSSGSMRGDDGSSRPKIVAAKEALTRLVDELPEGTPVGLRVYGHRVPNTRLAA
jgi:Ca-activated chloride channel family protein